MDLFHKISDIFELKSLDFKKQTKKTLLNWSKRVKFEKRREKFFQSCGDGKILSKVSICKNKDRPEWTKPLEGQKVKNIRKAIKAFLDGIGILDLDSKDQKQIQKLSEEKHWESVITLSEDGFEDRHKRGGGRSRPNRVSRHGRQEINPRFPHIRGQQTLNLRRGRMGNPRLTVDLRNRSPSPPEEWDAEDLVPLHDSRHRTQEILDTDAFEEQERYIRVQDEYIAELIKTRDRDLPTTKKTLEDLTPGFVTPLVSPKKRDPSPRPSPKKRDPSPPPSPALASGGGGPRGEIPRLPIQRVPYRSNCVLYDPDEVNCDPDDMSKFRLFRKKQQKELLDLAFERKKNCQKLDLMKLRIKEFELNERMWESFEHNRRGDFLSKFSKNDLNKFTKCGKNVIFSPLQMYQLKAVTNCLNTSQQLCQNYKDTKARCMQDKDALTSEYMLANFSYKTLEHMARNSKDPWVHRALKNREPEPPYQTAQLICEDERAPRREIILQKELGLDHFKKEPSAQSVEQTGQEKPTGTQALLPGPQTGPFSRVAGTSTGPITPIIPPIIPLPGPPGPRPPGLPFQSPYKQPSGPPWQPPAPPYWCAETVAYTSEDPT